jgi:adenine deaminase
MRDLSELRKLIACGKGNIPCDYKFSNVMLVNVVSAEIYPTDIYVLGKRIVSIDPNADLKANHVIDCQGMYALPGLIDTHMHFESSMLSPEAFANVIVPKGTTTLLSDLMEIANVAGKPGLREILESIKMLPYRMLLEVPSRVPTAPGLETTGAYLGVEEVDMLLDWEESLSLGEMDSGKILISLEDEYLLKVISALNRKKIVNGHAIGRLGQELNTYASTGISDDHECVTAQEMLERLRVGMKIMIREGSTGRNIEELIGAVVKSHLDTENLMFCTDDKDISDIEKEGHINYNINKSIELGLSPMKAIQMATINAAKHFRAEEDMGSIAPGRLADILLTKDIRDIQPEQVWYEGRLVAKEGKMIGEVPVRQYPEWIKNTVHLKRPVTGSSFVINSLYKTDRTASVRVINLIEGQIINKESQANLPAVNGKILCSTEKDILKIAVIERYGKNGMVGNGFVSGFGLKSGAIAYSMSHDHHNIVVVGTNDDDMATAVNKIADLHGGACVVENGEFKADMQLSIGGLMSEKNAEEVRTELRSINSAAAKLGCTLPSPFMSLSFVSLPTVPELGFSDKGLIDVNSQKIIEVVLS